MCLCDTVINYKLKNKKMDQNNQSQHGNVCGSCGNCSQFHGGHHMKFHLLRWILGIIIIFMIFSFGVKIGEFKSAFEGGDGYRGGRMMRYGGYQPNMMYGAYGQLDATPVTITTIKK